MSKRSRTNQSKGPDEKRHKSDDKPPPALVSPRNPDGTIIPLPLELWGCILEFIHLREKLSFRLVSRGWNYVIRIQTRYVSVYQDEVIPQVLRSFPNIEHVKFVEKPFTAKDLITLPKLRELTVLHVNLEPVHIEGLTGLQTINWSPAKDHPKFCLDKLFSTIIKAGTVNKLTLHDKYSHCNTCISKYAQMTSLQELNIIGGHKFNYQSIQYMVQNPNLLVLNLRGTDVEDCPENWHLGNFGNLREFSFSHDTFGDDQEKAIESLRARLAKYGVRVNIF